MSTQISIDALVVGGGVAGLFALGSIRNAGRSALLVESNGLGHGQTTSSQGILHAGLKYSLSGMLGGGAAEAAEAAVTWSRMLQGEAQPSLAGVSVLSDHCLVWRTSRVLGLAGMFGARLALRTKPTSVPVQQRPPWLAGVRGDVLRLAETVLDPREVLKHLASDHVGQLLHGAIHSVERRPDGMEVSIRCGEQSCKVFTQQLILTAGEGNEALLSLLGMKAHPPMQRRPLRQAMVCGDLPLVYGHCIDGAATRITVTSTNSNDGVVWNVGGELAEHGVAMDDTAFLMHARHEISSCLPGVHLKQARWSQFHVQRAEPRTPGASRPHAAFVQSRDRVTVVWPVKLVLAPQAAAAIEPTLFPSRFPAAVWPHHLPAPELAARPWENTPWRVLD